MSKPERENGCLPGGGSFRRGSAERSAALSREGGRGEKDRALGGEEPGGREPPKTNVCGKYYHVRAANRGLPGWQGTQRGASDERKPAGQDQGGDEGDVAVDTRGFFAAGGTKAGASFVFSGPLLARWGSWGNPSYEERVSFVWALPSLAAVFFAQKEAFYGVEGGHLGIDGAPSKKGGAFPPQTRAKPPRFSPQTTGESPGLSSSRPRGPSARVTPGSLAGKKRRKSAPEDGNFIP